MVTTVENRMASDTKVLQSYLGGKWQAGAEGGAALVNPTTGDTVARASSKGLDLKAALEYSRNMGGAELRQLTYGQRAELVGQDCRSCWRADATSGSRFRGRIPATPRQMLPLTSMVQSVH